MIPARFNAVLKTEDDKFLEIGYATVSTENGTISFENEFVPLLKLGTTAKIVRVIHEKETHSFIGSVYLSSRQLLQLVDVKDSILSELELYLPTDITMDGHVSLPEGGQPLGLLFRRSHAKVYSISLNSVRFMSKKEFEAGQRLILETKNPINLENVVIDIKQVISFGEDYTGYRCSIKSIPEESLSRLTDYMERVNIVFPQD